MLTLFAVSIPQPLTYWIESSPSTLPSEAKVEQLIDVDSGWWDSYLVMETYNNTMEENAILQILLSMLQSEDKQIWLYTHSISFIVKMAYW